MRNSYRSVSILILWIEATKMIDIPFELTFLNSKTVSMETKTPINKGNRHWTSECFEISVCFQDIFWLPNLSTQNQNMGVYLQVNLIFKFGRNERRKKVPIWILFSVKFQMQIELMVSFGSRCEHGLMINVLNFWNRNIPKTVWKYFSRL